jgi:hypothetical protein
MRAIESMAWERRSGASDDGPGRCAGGEPGLHQAVEDGPGFPIPVGGAARQGERHQQQRPLLIGIVERPRALIEEVAQMRRDPVAVQVGEERDHVVPPGQVGLEEELEEHRDALLPHLALGDGVGHAVHVGELRRLAHPRLQVGVGGPHGADEDQDQDPAREDGCLASGGHVQPA